MLLVTCASIANSFLMPGPPKYLCIWWYLLLPWLVMWAIFSIHLLQQQVCQASNFISANTIKFSASFNVGLGLQIHKRNIVEHLYEEHLYIGTLVCTVLLRVNYSIPSGGSGMILPHSEEKTVIHSCNNHSCIIHENQGSTTWDKRLLLITFLQQDLLSSSIGRNDFKSTDANLPQASSVNIILAACIFSSMCGTWLNGLSM